MRFPLAVAVVLVSFSLSGWAQQKNQFKVKPSAPEKTSKKSSVPLAKTTTGPAATSSANSKDLNALEHQTAKTLKPSQSAAKKTPPVKMEKDKANPPINVAGGRGGGKGSGTVTQSANPYKGRLRQKHSHQ